MKIYTKTGDKGTTSLIGGRRIAKHDAQIEAYGTVDELIAFVGLLRDTCPFETISSDLLQIQSDLMFVAAHLTYEIDKQQNNLSVVKNSIIRLESLIDAMDQELEPLKSFILSGGHILVSQCHVARTICRRAERRVSVLVDDLNSENINLQFLNRLSDYLFTLSRCLSKKLGCVDIPWKIS